jgi:hypothetical protein
VRRDLENWFTVSWRPDIASFTGRFMSRCQERPSVTRAVERVGRVETYWDVSLVNSPIKKGGGD